MPSFKSRAKRQEIRKARPRGEKRLALLAQKEAKEAAEQIDDEGARKLSQLEQKRRILAETQEKRRLQREEQTRQRHARLAALVPSFDASVSNHAPKGYDWKLLYIEAYRTCRNPVESRKVADIGYASVRNAKHDDPVFRAALEEIDAEFMETLGVEADDVHQKLMDCARAVNEPNDLTGGIEGPRVTAALAVLKAHKRALFGESVAVKVDATVSLPGVVMDAISRAAGAMSFESIPEADAVTVA